MDLGEDQAIRQLAGMAVFYRSTEEFLSALELGVESDFKRCGNKKYISEAVTLMTSTVQKVWSSRPYSSAGR